MRKTPVQVLEDEHRTIEKVVAALGRQRDTLEAGRAPDLDLIDHAVEFLRTYADCLHHGKEEATFFPALEEHGVPPEGCPLGALRAEHIAGRAGVDTLARAAAECRVTGSSPACAETLTPALRALVELYGKHIWKEDYLAFPMAGKVLTPEDQDRMLEQFLEVDRAVGTEAIRAFEEFAEGVAG